MATLLDIKVGGPLNHSVFLAVERVNGRQEVFMDACHIYDTQRLAGRWIGCIHSSEDAGDWPMSSKTVKQYDAANERFLREREWVVNCPPVTLPIRVWWGNGDVSPYTYAPSQGAWFDGTALLARSRFEFAPLLAQRRAFGLTTEIESIVLAGGQWKITVLPKYTRFDFLDTNWERFSPADWWFRFSESLILLENAIVSHNKKTFTNSVNFIGTPFRQRRTSQVIQNGMFILGLRKFINL